MRRLFASLSALAFFGALVGCNHTCGVCDCDPCNHSCCCSCAGMGYHSASGAYYAPAQAPQAVEMTPPPAAKPSSAETLISCSSPPSMSPPTAPATAPASGKA